MAHVLHQSDNQKIIIIESSIEIDRSLYSQREQAKTLKDSSASLIVLSITVLLLSISLLRFSFDILALCSLIEVYPLFFAAMVELFILVSSFEEDRCSFLELVL